MTGQGRGRPAIFDPDMQTVYLRLLAAGIRVQDAADKLGISRRTPTQHAHRDRQFARQLAKAKQAGREVRIPHGTPGGYTNHACRCAPCTAAATKARTAYRARTNTAPHEGATVLPLPAPNPPTGEPKNLTPAESLFRIAAGL